MKGLPRSMSRANPVVTAVIRNDVDIDHDLVVANGSAAPGFGTVVVGDFPVGKILLLGTRVQDLVFSTADADAIATWAGSFSVGSAPTADATLNGSEVDLVASTVLAAATAKVSPTQDVSAWKGVLLDNADGSLEINLNVTVDDASQSGDIAMHAKGQLELIYAVL